ncbi:hypothetical protein ACFE04_027147 [Oxalis oulophora]
MDHCIDSKTYHMTKDRNRTATLVETSVFEFLTESGYLTTCSYRVLRYWVYGTFAGTAASTVYDLIHLSAVFLDIICLVNFVWALRVLHCPITLRLNIDH